MSKTFKEYQQAGKEFIKSNSTGQYEMLQALVGMAIGGSNYDIQPQKIEVSIDYDKLAEAVVAKMPKPAAKVPATRKPANKRVNKT